MTVRPYVGKVRYKTLTLQYLEIPDEPVGSRPLDMALIVHNRTDEVRAKQNTASHGQDT